ncbi:SMP-30/gluconolactonase/LRE family protein [Flavobacteriaceae bacterium]|nr:SMP-30/gluconolactonase/LRE family protein [Flavobacteriaceae bacterium]
MKKTLTLVLTLGVLFDITAQKTLGSVERLDPEINTLIAADAVIEILADGFSWAEGPVWVPELNAVLFTDVPENKMYRWDNTNGLSIYLDPSGYTGIAPNDKKNGANGLILDSKGNLLIAQHGDRRIALVEKPLTQPGSFKTKIAKYDGKRFNSPNDLILAKNGDLYFTDPPYGLKGDDDPLKEIAENSVYRLDTKGEVAQVYIGLNRPNGLAFSPDESVLYIANSDPKRNLWLSFSLENGVLKDEKIFYNATGKQGKGLADGLKVHSKGYVFATGPGGVLIFTPKGKHIGTIKTEVASANCAFNADQSALYITSNNYLTRIQLIN